MAKNGQICKKNCQSTMYNSQKLAKYRASNWQRANSHKHNENCRGGCILYTLWWNAHITGFWTTRQALQHHIYSCKHNIHSLRCLQNLYKIYTCHQKMHLFKWRRPSAQDTNPSPQWPQLCIHIGYAYKLASLRKIHCFVWDKNNKTKHDDSTIYTATFATPLRFPQHFMDWWQ